MQEAKKSSGGMLLVFPLDTNPVPMDKDETTTTPRKTSKPHVADFNGLMIPGPQHIEAVPTEHEPLYKATEGLRERMKTLDATRRNSKKFSNVVFDITTTNPLLTNIDSPIYEDGNYEGLETDPVEGTSPMEQDVEKMQLQHEGLLQGCVPPYYIPTSPNDTTLIFESRFESGNLRKVVQVSEFEYDLRLNYDKGTRGHTQWFYFSVSNMIEGRKYKFNIVNLMKPDSLFNLGMKPLVYSEKHVEKTGIGWHRCGYDIIYYKNKLKRDNKHFYTLTWTYQCENDNDTCFFAQCYPYTFSYLQDFLAKAEERPESKRFLKREVMAKSLGDMHCDVLTITAFESDPEQIRNRKGVVISARVHPGEVNASWMMHGVINFLLSDTPEANALREQFVFKIIPMLNPDGVTYGNYRCNLAGADLNRKYDFPTKDRHPIIVGMKRCVKKFTSEREVLLFCDLHGHSRKKNIFMYGCLEANDYQKSIDIKIFPKLLAKMSTSFSYKNCSFNLSQLKLNTGRIVMYSEFGIKHSFTMEASFCGPEHSDYHFLPSDLEDMGKTLLQALLVYHIDPQIVDGIRQELIVMHPPATVTPVQDGIASLGSDDGENSDLLLTKLRKYKHKKIRKSTAGKGQLRHFQELTIVKDDSDVADDETEEIKFKYNIEDNTPKKKKSDAANMTFPEPKQNRVDYMKALPALGCILIIVIAFLYRTFY